MGGFINKISQNGRYFTDNEGSPVFWLGDTQWNLFRCHTLEEAQYIIDDRKDKGFTVIQVMLQGFSRGVKADAIYGEAFLDSNPSKPNYAYFKHTDAIIDYACRKGITLAIGIDHPVMKLIHRYNARTFGRWLGERYKNYPNIIWVASYLVPKGENLEITREQAYGLAERNDKKQLITCHPDPAMPTATSSVSHNEPWLDFNCIQSYASIDLIYDNVSTDWRRAPHKPVVLAEGAYEDGPEYCYDVSPYLVRKQAYLSYFAGGHHSYGHNDNWRVLPGWKTHLDTPGVRQLRILKEVFTSLCWWEMSPDQTLFGKYDSGCCPVNMALKSLSGDLVMVYATKNAAFSIRKDRLQSDGSDVDKGAAIDICWINLENKNVISVETGQQKDIYIFKMPEGWEDGILLLKKIL